MATKMRLVSSQDMPQPSSNKSKTVQESNKPTPTYQAFSLVPSQVQASPTDMEGSRTETTNPSHLPTAHDSDSQSNDNDNGNNNKNGNKTPQQRTKARGSKGDMGKNKKKKPKAKSKSSNGKNAAFSPQSTRRHGNFPDVYWRCVPMDHLRQHPNFVPLPLSESIDHIAQLEDIRNFRQESWQWDAVHEGRCTTSQAVAALGFLEPEAGTILGVPRSWHRGGMGAYHRLRRPALRTLEEMNTVLCQSNEDNKYEPEDESIWAPPIYGNNKSQFAAKYCIPVDEKDRKQRLQEMKHRHHHSPTFDSSVRMIWGNTQESTALLTALNYFVEEGGNEVKLHEIGMCGGGAKLEGSKLLLGATPDGLICHPDGRKEVLEVKNHCPFFSSSRRNNNNNRPQSQFNIRPGNLLPKDGSKKAGVLPHYVPQLMMEIYCMGSDCRSAIMVRQTATAGALVIRIHRDDGWIEEMLYWLQRFQSDFVDTATPPPPNFFLQKPDESPAGDLDDDDTSRERYRKFLDWTIDLESKVDLLDHVPNSKIQRANSAIPGTFVDLFLD